MDNERIKQTMESFGTYSMCMNCGKCDRTYRDTTKEAVLEVDYHCMQNNGRDIAHPRMHCTKWEPNKNMLILFSEQKVELRTTPYEKAAVQKTDEQIETERLITKMRAKTVQMHGLGETYQKMHDELQDEMHRLERQIDPLETKEGALKALIYENAKPQYLQHYQAQLAEVSAQLDALYLEYDPMAERLKELAKKAEYYTYYVPTLPKEEKKAFVRPQTMMEGVAEDMPTFEEILEFLGLSPAQKMQIRVNEEVRKAVAIMRQRREAREDKAKKAAAAYQKSKARRTQAV